MPCRAATRIAHVMHHRHAASRRPLADVAVSSEVHAIVHCTHAALVRAPLARLCQSRAVVNERMQCFTAFAPPPPPSACGKLEQSASGAEASSKRKRAGPPTVFLGELRRRSWVKRGLADLGGAGKGGGSADLAGRAQSRCRCEIGEPSPSEDVAWWAQFW
jgi:hypothetical protein